MTSTATVLAKVTAIATPGAPQQSWVEQLNTVNVPLTLLLSLIAIFVSLYALYESGGEERAKRKLLAEKLKVYLADIEGFLKEIEERLPKMSDPNNPIAATILYPTLMLESFSIAENEMRILAELVKADDMENSLLYLRSQIHGWYSQQATLSTAGPILHYPANAEGIAEINNHKEILLRLQTKIKTVLGRI